MFKRFAYDNLLKWKENNRKNSKKKGLIVRGARQVGKTFLIREFGKREYRSFIEVNFLELPEMKNVFTGSLSVSSMLMNFSVYFPGAEFTEGDTLLFLDEIQECPEAVTSLKFWAEDGRFDVIASGSMLGIDYKRSSSYPVGFTEYLDMTSLDFGEFLLACGIGENVTGLLRESFERKESVPEAVNMKISEYLRYYMAVGGMPEAVSAFVTANSLLEADRVQRRILADYRYDIAHYASSDIKIKAENCYFSLPAQLGKPNRKFQYSVVEKGSSARKYGSSVDWLKQADLVIKVCNADPVMLPLETHVDVSDFRLYPTDIGLFTAMMDYSLKAMILDAGNKGMSPDTKGGLFEALAAEMLYKAGRRNLCFTRNPQGTFKIEFILPSENGAIPVEVKSGRSRSVSLDIFLKKSGVPFGYKLTNGNVGVSGKKITLPQYMAMFLN